MTCKHTRDWAPWFQLQSERACPSWWHIFFTLSRACWTCRWPDGTSPPLIRSYGKRCTLGEFERIFCKPPQQWTTSGMFLLKAVALPCQSTPLAGYEWFDDLFVVYVWKSYLFHGYVIPCYLVPASERHGQEFGTPPCWDTSPLSTATATAPKPPENKPSQFRSQ